MTDDIERAATPADTSDDTSLGEGVGGVPDIPQAERATVGDADDDNVDTDEPQTDLNR